jgi:hypothetical protein
MSAMHDMTREQQTMSDVSFQSIRRTDFSISIPFLSLDANPLSHFQFALELPVQRKSHGANFQEIYWSIPT